MAEGNALKGVLLVMAAVFLFALADTVGKHLVALYAAPLILAARYVINLGLLSVVLGPSQGADLWRTKRTGLVVLRGLFLAAASISMMLALRVMPLGETVAIIYLAPFLVMFLSGPLLGERATLAGWIGAAVAFAGVLLIARPGSGLDPWGVALCVVNAGLSTGYHLLTRILAKTETTKVEQPSSMDMLSDLSGEIIDLATDFGARMKRMAARVEEVALGIELEREVTSANLAKLTQLQSILKSLS